MSSSVRTLVPVSRAAPPMLPSDYERAVTLIKALQNVDEAKVWHDRAEALAAWSKIYNDNELGRQARRLKLLAYRRMSELTRELTPAEANDQLRRSGLNRHAVGEVRAFRKLSQRLLDEAIAAPQPPTVSTLLKEEASPDGCIRSLRSLQYFSTRCSPQQAARMMSRANVDYYRQHLPVLVGWLQSLGAAL